MKGWRHSSEQRLEAFIPCLSRKLCLIQIPVLDQSVVGPETLYSQPVIKLPHNSSWSPDFFAQHLKP
jgi:hypothetical protein